MITRLSVLTVLEVSDNLVAPAAILKLLALQ